MFRPAVSSASTVLLRRISRGDGGGAASRNLVTSAQKRAQKRSLDKHKLTGEPAAATTPVSEKIAEGGAGSAPSAGVKSSGGGGIVGPLVVVGILGAAGYGLYETDNLPFLKKEGASVPDVTIEKEIVVTEKKEEAAVEEKPASSVEEPKVPVEEVVTKEEPVSTPAAPAKEEKAVKEGPHRVSVESQAAVGFPPKDPNRAQPEVSTIGHPVDGNRVTLISRPSAAEEEPPSPPPITASLTRETSASELHATAEKSDLDVRAALRILQSELSEEFLKDLDTASATELKIRLARLTAEITEKARWEALRIQQLLAAREKDTEDKFLDVLQKQRREFEDILASRLREREDELLKHANATLAQKHSEIQSLVNATAAALELEHAEDLKSKITETSSSLEAKYQSQYKNKLAEEKNSFGKELESLRNKIAALTDNLQKIQNRADLSAEFESGSQRAHRISAAGLALSEKLQDGKPAVAELAAFREAVMGDGSEGGVLGAIVPTLAKQRQDGVPTLPELQEKFETVFPICREAAMVPAGRADLASQLFGKVFAFLTSAPSPDDFVSEGADPKDAEDFILARAKKFVHLGDLERAAEVLDGLGGESQTAFVVSDWKEMAKDRVRVDKALKVIKLECALLNENMGGVGN